MAAWRTISAPVRRCLVEGYRVLGNAAYRVAADPVVVLGNQKSGTTAVAALLGRATGCSVTLDIPPLWYPTLGRMFRGEVPLAEFVTRHRRYFSRRIWKEPGLGLVFPELRALVSAARFVLLVRDPRDNARSLLNRLGVRRLGDGAGVDDLPEMPPAWREVFTGPWVAPGLTTCAEILAERWNLFADLHLARPEVVPLARYEDFVRRKPAWISELARSLGLDPRHDIGDHVEMVFQPRGDSAVAHEAFFSSGDLRVIEARCRERMEALGYPV